MFRYITLSDNMAHSYELLNSKFLSDKQIISYRFDGNDSFHASEFSLYIEFLSTTKIYKRKSSVFDSISYLGTNYPTRPIINKSVLIKAWEEHMVMLVKARMYSFLGRL
jgi:hypothetical protein